MELSIDQKLLLVLIVSIVVTINLIFLIYKEYQTVKMCKTYLRLIEELNRDYSRE